MISIPSITEILRSARVQTGMSQRELAKASGVTQANINKIERNQIDPRVSTIRRLLDRLGYELIAVPKQSLPLLRDLLHPDDDAPFIDIGGDDR